MKESQVPQEEQAPLPSCPCQASSRPTGLSAEQDHCNFLIRPVDILLLTSKQESCGDLTSRETASFGRDITSKVIFTRENSCSRMTGMLQLISA